jgi:LPXTG-motif cell wall-anchored protein
MTTNTRTSKKIYAITSILAFALIAPAVVLISTSQAANPVIRQGSTSTYGVLAASTVTNTGISSISGTAGGDVGLSPGTSFTGGATLTRSGADHITDVAASTAQLDLVVAYNDLSVPTTTSLASSDLAGQTIQAGTYSTVAGTLANSGTVTFDAQGDSTAIFVLRAASTLITSPASSMTLINGAQACNIYWQVGSSATVGVNSTVSGHIYALTSITANSGATINGQLLARNGAVTLDATRIVNNSCVTPAPVVTATPAPVVTATPAPVVTATPVVTTTPAPVVTATPVVTYNPLAPRVTSTFCISTTEYKASLVGNFPDLITAVSVNGVHIAASRWSQTDHRVVVIVPAGASPLFSVALLVNDKEIAPLTTFDCAPITYVEPVVVVTPTPVATTPAGGLDVETPTVDGGTLPNTAGDGYTYLLAGLVLMGLGSAGFLFRKNLQQR